MNHPKGYEDGTKQVCKLQKIIYEFYLSRCKIKIFNNILNTDKLSLKSVFASNKYNNETNVVIQQMMD